MVSRTSTRGGFSLRLVRLDGSEAIELASGDLNLPGGCSYVAWPSQKKVVYGTWDAAARRTRLWAVELDARYRAGAPRLVAEREGALVARGGTADEAFVLQVRDDYDVHRARVGRDGRLGKPEPLWVTPHREVNSDAWRGSSVALTTDAAGDLDVGWLDVEEPTSPRMELVGPGDQALPLRAAPTLFVERKAATTELVLDRPAGRVVAKSSTEPNAHPFLPIALLGCCRGETCYAFQRQRGTSRFWSVDVKTGAATDAFALDVEAQTCALIDERRMIYVTASRQLRVRELSSGTERPLKVPVDLSVYRVATRGGFPLYVTAHRPGDRPAYVLARVAEDGATEVLHEDTDGWLFNPTFSPDGAWLVFSRQPYRSTLYRVTSGAPPGAQPRDAAAH